MKKLKFYCGVVAAALSVLTPVCGYAVGVSDVMSLSQGELAFYIVLGGAALAMIGSICLLFALLFKGRSSKEDYDDEYYDDEYYDEYEDDYDEEYEDSDNYEDDTYDEDSDSDEAEEIEDADDSINKENDENDENENNQVEEDTTEDNLPEAENLQTEEAVSDVPKSVKDKSEASTDNESDIEDSKSDVNTDDKESAEKVMITLSGVNSPDVKIVEFSDFATVGRRNTNSLMIADNAVSGVHCKFIYSDGEVVLEDMNSTNGTVLNDEKITSAKVKTGDIVIIGKCKYKLNVSVSKN